MAQVLPFLSSSSKFSRVQARLAFFKIRALWFWDSQAKPQGNSAVCRKRRLFVHIFQKRPDVHKIVLSVELLSPPPGSSVNFEDFLLICAVFPHFGPFWGGRGKTRFLQTKVLWTPRLF